MSEKGHFRLGDDCKNASEYFYILISGFLQVGMLLSSDVAASSAFTALCQKRTMSWPYREQTRYRLCLSFASPSRALMVPLAPGL